MPLPIPREWSRAPLPTLPAPSQVQESCLSPTALGRKPRLPTPGVITSSKSGPGTYGLGVYPALEAADGFRGISGVVVAEAATTIVDIHLPPGGGSAHLSGAATYGDSAPDAGVEVVVSPERYEIGVPFRASTTTTDESGHCYDRAQQSGRNLG